MSNIHFNLSFCIHALITIFKRLDDRLPRLIFKTIASRILETWMPHDNFSVWGTYVCEQRALVRISDQPLLGQNLYYGVTQHPFGVSMIYYDLYAHWETRSP